MSLSRAQRIHQLINQALNPSFLQVENESNKHHVPKDAETHFHLLIVAEEFNNLPKIARHRMLNKLLAAEFNSGLHALSLHLYTATEWEDSKRIAIKSPSCLDGYRHG
jgi:BolA family transcriptional regulator, general stress-responsive regulator